MKKTAKILSAIVLSMLMIVMSIVPVFAVDYTYIEDHSKVDCVHYYKKDGNYYFLIKCPKGQLEHVSLSLTKTASGSAGPSSISFKYTTFTGLYGKEHVYSDNDYDYTLFVAKYGEYPDYYVYGSEGVGIKIYYSAGNNTVYMATNTANYSTEPGNGYFLSRY